MHEATIITDGSADNSSGTGGWCAITVVGSTVTEIVGYEDSTTSNRMELLAAIEGLRAFKSPTKIRLVSDSSYMLKTLRHKWYERWFEEEQSHRPNMDLWEILVGLIHYHDVDYEKVKGHSGDYWNERADQLAKQARKEKVAMTQTIEDFDIDARCGELIGRGKDKQCQLFKGHFGKHYFSNKTVSNWDAKTQRWANGNSTS